MVQDIVTQLFKKYSALFSCYFLPLTFIFSPQHPAPSFFCRFNVPFIDPYFHRYRYI